MVDFARRCPNAFRRIVVPLALLVAAPLGAGETIFSDSFELGECSVWSASSNPVAYPDFDEDTWGDTSQPTVYCELPDGYVLVDGDCDDGESSINPIASEICDGADNDCNGETMDGDDELWLGDPCDGTDSDVCTDGMFVCASAMKYCSDSGEENLEVCNGADDDCDSFADEDFECIQSEIVQCGVTDVGECQYGTQACSASCSWGSCEGSVDPVAEICDGLDNDCDGSTDEGCLPPLSCTSVLDASVCTNNVLPQLNLGSLSAADCRTQCQFAMPQSGMTSGCWIVAGDTTCYCRDGTLSVGGSSPGGSCS